jgi:heme-degrading monooxygenase HmoA
MFSVIFEVNRKPGHIDDYLALAKHLKPFLERIDGFVDNERFESQLRQGWLLSHSTWRDEKSVIRWRNESEHHGAVGRDFSRRAGNDRRVSRAAGGHRRPGRPRRF